VSIFEVHHQKEKMLMYGRKLHLWILIVLVLSMVGAIPIAAQMGGRSSTLTQPRTSPHDVISSTFDGERFGNRVMIVYGRPFSKNPRGENIRKIWGVLVPWGQRWRLGADESTLMITQKPLKFGSLDVPAGTYSLYMLPVEQGNSQLIINKQFGQWGIAEPYQESMEVGRIDLKRETVRERVDQLTLALERGEGGGGVLRITWENLTFSAPFSVGK
jgi:hypothetical protein